MAGFRCQFEFTGDADSAAGPSQRKAAIQPPSAAPVATKSSAITPLPPSDRSVRAFSKQNHAHRFEEDQHVKKQRMVLHVVEIELQLGPCLLDRSAVRVPHLRPARQTRLDAVAQIVEGNLFLQLRDEVGTLWTWPDKAHLAAHHVEQLRQLVDAQLA